jgi:hypothetical protein
LSLEDRSILVDTFRPQKSQSVVSMKKGYVDSDDGRRELGQQEVVGMIRAVGAAAPLPGDMTVLPASTDLVDTIDGGPKPACRTSPWRMARSQDGFDLELHVRSTLGEPITFIVRTSSQHAELVWWLPETVLPYDSFLARLDAYDRVGLRDAWFRHQIDAPSDFDRSEHRTRSLEERTREESALVDRACIRFLLDSVVHREFGDAAHGFGHTDHAWSGDLLPDEIGVLADHACAQRRLLSQHNARILQANKDIARQALHRARSMIVHGAVPVVGRLLKQHHDTDTTVSDAIGRNNECVCRQSVIEFPSGIIALVKEEAATGVYHLRHHHRADVAFLGPSFGLTGITGITGEIPDGDVRIEEDRQERQRIEELQSMPARDAAYMAMSIRDIEGVDDGVQVLVHPEFAARLCAPGPVQAPIAWSYTPDIKGGVLRLYDQGSNEQGFTLSNGAISTRIPALIQAADVSVRPSHSAAQEPAEDASQVTGEGGGGGTSTLEVVSVDFDPCDPQWLHWSASMTQRQLKLESVQRDMGVLPPSMMRMLSGESIDALPGPVQRAIVELRRLSRARIESNRRQAVLNRERLVARRIEEERSRIGGTEAMPPMSMGSDVPPARSSGESGFMGFLRKLFGGR